MQSTPRATEMSVTISFVKYTPFVASLEGHVVISEK